MYNILRKKRISLASCLVISVLFGSANLQAQLRDGFNLPNSDEKPYHIGIVIMGAQSRFQVSQHPKFLEQDSILVTSPQNTMGFGIGGMHTLRLSNRFEARVVFPQLMFVNKAITYHVKYPKANLD